jgi:uncharacterized protein (DUF1778 family)
MGCHSEFMATVKGKRPQARVDPLGKSLLERAASRAEEVLAERRRIHLSSRAATAFSEVLERPAQINVRLAKALRQPRAFSWLD